MPSYRVMVCDPPWRFSDRLPGGSRGAERHYPTLSLAELCTFPLPQLERNGVLFMWRVASMPLEALALCKAWGFEPKSEIVWAKRTASGKRHFGMGRYVRAEHETCLVAVRGRAFPKVHSVRSIFEAPVGKHSAKPEAFFDLVESLYDGPYVELFARRQRPNWTCLGNEVA